MPFHQTKKFAFCLCAALVAVFLVVSFLNINDYGETWDESVHWWSGQVNADIFAGRAPIQEIENVHNLQYYGPLADVIGQESKVLFADQLHWLDEVAARHVHLIIFGAILLVAVFCLGYLTGGTLTAFLSSIFLLLFPRFIGESQGNPKDLPVAALFALAIMFFVWAWQKKRWWLFILAAVVLGLALAIRVNALWVPLILVIWILIAYRDRIWSGLKSRDRKARFADRWKKWGWTLLAYPFIAFGTMVACWPWLWVSPVSRFWQALLAISEYQWDGLVKYGGVIYKATNLPWHYGPVMLFWVTPALILVLVVVGLIVVIKQTKNLSNRVGVLYPIWLVVILGSIILLRISVYDGIRHFFPVVPSLVLLAGIGGSGLYRWLGRKFARAPVCPGQTVRGSAPRNPVCRESTTVKPWSFTAAPVQRRLAAIVLTVIIAVASGAVVYKMMEIHPYQLYYYNELAGGMGGAYPYYEVGFWGIEMKEGAAWLNEHASEGARVAVLPTAKMAIPYLRSDLVTVKEREDPDYCMYVTKAGFEPFESVEPIYILAVDGAPLLEIKQIKPVTND